MVFLPYYNHFNQNLIKNGFRWYLYLYCEKKIAFQSYNGHIVEFILTFDAKCIYIYMCQF